MTWRLALGTSKNLPLGIAEVMRYGRGLRMHARRTRFHERPARVNYFGGKRKQRQRWADKFRAQAEFVDLTQDNTAQIARRTSLTNGQKRFVKKIENSIW
eukprot:TRINITY_DN37535_c0_g1_i1.p1 TRINITY_DN37535_c0_g1~~TRINITY_DN37535_c0_g1_i1.p1  ORF type:complete len:100 (+),score=4.51 TRINITY_DN37535_c0_g1_i1:208-507(+)